MCKTTRLTKETLSDWLPPPMDFIKLNFDECSLGNLGQREIGGLLRDNFVVVRVFSQLVDQGFVVKVEILAHLGGLLQEKALDFSNLLVEGSFVIVISWTTKKERGLEF